MKAWIVRQFGGLDKMKWEDLPDPEPVAGEVLIDVVTSGINFAESRMRDGSYKGTPLPHILGLECGGTIAKLGAGVTKFKVGDRVMARTRGSHATKVLADARKTHALPPNMSFEEGAAVPVGWHTAWHALVTVANVQPGQRVLIEAVASSVGSAALQIAKHRGAWVAGTASRDDKLAVAKQWGCDAVYNYKSPDWSAKVLADTGGKGIDVSCATIGADTIQALLDCMGQEGKVLNYGSTSGIVITYNLRIGERNISLHSMSIDSSPKYLPITLPTFEAQAVPLFAAGGFKGVVATVLLMSQLPRAHEMIHERTHFGKIIMKNG